MRALAGEEILEAWERTRALPQHQAALACLALAMPERAMDDLAAVPLSLWAEENGYQRIQGNLLGT